MLDFCFNLYLEIYGLHHLLNRFVIFNKNVLMPLDHFIMKNLILLIWTLCFNILLSNCLQVQKIFNFTGCSRNSKKLCSNAPTQNFSRDTGAVESLQCQSLSLSNNLVWNSTCSM